MGMPDRGKVFFPGIKITGYLWIYDFVTKTKNLLEFCLSPMAGDETMLPDGCPGWYLDVYSVKNQILKRGS